MTFDELLDTWKTQDNRPLYTIGDDALHRALQARTRILRRTLVSNELQNYWTSLWIAVFLMYLFWRGFPATGTTPGWYLFILWTAVAGVFCYVLYSFFIVGRRTIQAHVPDFSLSLRNRLEREIAYLADQIASRVDGKRVLIHLLPPWSACIVIVLAMNLHAGEPFRWLDLLSIVAVTGGWIHTYRLQRKWVHRELIPRKRELDGLLRLLDEPGMDPGEEPE